MSEREIDRLPDPDLFRDAVRLKRAGVRWTPRELDECDALLLALLDKFKPR